MRQEASIMECDRSHSPQREKNECDDWIPNKTENRKLEDEYLLGDLIGRGASSVVYKCLRKGRTEWACKVLKKKLLDKKSFQREINLLLTLKHPNIVQFKDVFETPDEIQMIFEMASGGELFERIVERGHYTEEDASQAVRHVLNALQYLHNKGITHRGIKPENLLYKSPADGSILQLSDFGTSRLMRDECQATSRICGTFGLYAPEILQNEKYDSSIDLWCLGVVTYIMLCGFEPFWDEQSQAATNKKVLEGDFSFPSPSWDEISDSAKDLVSKLLLPDPKKRPTATEALNHSWISGTSASSLPMTNETLIKLREFNARRRFRVATTAVIATQRALSYLPVIKSRESKDKSVKENCENFPLDSSTNDLFKNCEVCEKSMVGGVSNRQKNNVELENRPIEGRAIEEKLSTNLLTDLSAQHKESYMDLRQTSELEKRRLEAELKAAEEMARIKETVIEKRLAFELASIQNSIGPPPPPPPPQQPLPVVREAREKPVFQALTSRTDAISDRSVANPIPPTEQANRSQIPAAPPQKSSLLPMLDDFPKLSTNNIRKFQGTIKTVFAEPKVPMVTNVMENTPSIEKTERNFDDAYSSHDEESESGSDENSMENLGDSNRPSETENENNYREESCPRTGTRSKFFWKSMMSKMKTKIKFRKANKW